jgi:hypothetical protein
MEKVKGKRGELLIKNIIFILLNLMFLAIMVAFLVKQSSGAAFLEESYSKQIALMIDAAQPGTIIKFNMEKAMKVAKEENFPFENVVRAEKNFIIVQLSEKSGKEYSFFNDVDVDFYPSQDNETSEYTGMYTITIDKIAREDNE